jgi:hypothetical protein
MMVGRNNVSAHRAIQTKEAYTSDKKSVYCIRTIKEKKNTMCSGCIWHSQGQEKFQHEASLCDVQHPGSLHSKTFLGKKH